jgi:5'-deoxynucleotidase YfbR-like HD superfamily hydrolase
MSENFCLTVSGKVIDFARLDAHQLAIEDVSNGLAVMPRWAGQTDWERHGFAYSVAQHAYHVSGVVKTLGGSAVEQLCGLHHDDFEAFGCDVPTPLKRLCPDYVAAEKRSLAVIFECFGIPAGWAEKLPDVVREADAIMLATEARDVCHVDMAKYIETRRALPSVLDVWAPVKAKWKYILRHQELSPPSANKK